MDVVARKYLIDACVSLGSEHHTELLSGLTLFSAVVE